MFPSEHMPKANLKLSSYSSDDTVKAPDVDASVETDVDPMEGNPNRQHLAG